MECAINVYTIYYAAGSYSNRVSAYNYNDFTLNPLQSTRHIKLFAIYKTGLTCTSQQFQFN